MAAEAEPSREARHQSALARRREYAAAYREKNRERIRAYVNDYNAKNRDRVNERERLGAQRRNAEARDKQEKAAERRRLDAERAKRWAEANPERARETQRRWVESHPEAVKAAQRRYEETHREARRESSREHARRKRETDPEAHRQQQREWRDKNKERLNQASRERLAAEAPEQRERRLATAAATRELRRELAAKGLPSPRTRRPPAHHVPTRTAAAQKFFDRERTASEISILRRELATRLPVGTAVSNREKTPPEKLSEWQRDSRLARARFNRASNMARLAQNGRLTVRLDEIASALWERRGDRIRDELAMESRARALHGKPTLDIDSEVRRAVMSAARKRFDRELESTPKGDEAQDAALRALNALRASYPTKAHRGKVATPPQRPRLPPQTPRTDRGRDR